MQSRVGVLRGGPSHEYDISLASGGYILRELPEEFQSHDILVTKDGTWHQDGVPVAVSSLANQLDVVVNSLHGEFGEDGRVQQLLDSVFIPYTGSGHLASALGMHKGLTKQIVAETGVKMARHRIVRVGEDPTITAQEIFSTLCPPWVIKPANRNSSLGLTLAHNAREIADALALAQGYSDITLVEEYVRGREATINVIDNYRGERYYTTLPLEIKRPAGKLFDFNAKYNDRTLVRTPGSWSEQEHSALKETALAVYQALGAKHYARVDLILTRNGVYLLEINTQPPILPESLFVEGLKSTGISTKQFLGHIIRQSLGHR